MNPLYDENGMLIISEDVKRENKEHAKHLQKKKYNRRIKRGE
jgi:hypothetical protein